MLHPGPSCVSNAPRPALRCANLPFWGPYKGRSTHLTASGLRDAGPGAGTGADARGVRQQRERAPTVRSEPFLRVS